MKKVLLFLFTLLLNSTFFAQALVEENFDYTTGTLTTVTSNWAESPTGSTDIQILSGSLSYNSYASSGVGNKISLNGGATGRSGVIRTFTSQSGNGTTVYFSFLLNVTSTADMDISTSSGDYFANFQNSTLSQIRSYVYVRQGSNSSKFSIGLAKSSPTSLTWFSTELNTETTYLIVIAYIFQSGDDLVKLWVNPSLSGSEPSADLSITSGAEAADISYIQFRQNSKSGDMDVDGIRVATSWSQAPLPVELASFNSLVFDNKVQLNWSTATEINNYGFSVERRTKREEWKEIAFILGHGNSNVPNEYTYVDQPTGGSEFQYRLKQIDLDGTFEYSWVIDVSLEEVKQFVLEQNYPNPFNPTTNISYRLPVDSKVTLKIYDILGREVATLIDEYQQAGYYNSEFSINQLYNKNISANRLSSGVYLYQLTANNFKQTRKFVIVK